jgi:hypothetical protein
VVDRRPPPPRRSTIARTILRPDASVTVEVATSLEYAVSAVDAGPDGGLVVVVTLDGGAG